jgi:signal peptidase II
VLREHPLHGIIGQSPYVHQAWRTNPAAHTFDFHRIGLLPDRAWPIESRMARTWSTRLVVVAGAVIADDQFTKMIAARRGLVANNPAYALGVFGGPPLLLSAGTVAIMVAFLAFVVPRAIAFRVSPVACGLIVGGMLGNTLDRIRFGVARDFLATPWAIVNLADIAVAAGIVLLFVGSARLLSSTRSSSLEL